MNHLDEAREKITKASEIAEGPVHTQLNSLRRGIFQEEGGDTTQDEPGPKIERVSEVADKLDGLDADVEDERTRAYIEEALDHVYAYMDEHPHGGDQG